MGRPLLNRVLLITPPFVQPNTWYPATTFLAGFLKQNGFDPVQRDLSLEVLLHLLSDQGLAEIEQRSGVPLGRHREVIGEVVEFLQHPRAGAAQRLVQPGVLPEGPRFLSLRELPGGIEREFGRMGVLDLARHRASLFIDDLVDLVRAKVDPEFGFSRYAEKIAASQPDFSVIERSVQGASLLREWIDLRVSALPGERPLLVGITVPFPGNLVGALVTARSVKAKWPEVPVALGGGYINTELRELSEPGLFDSVDFVTLDSGEEPIRAILSRLSGESVPLERTFTRQGGQVVYSGQHSPPLRQKEVGHPTTEGLPTERYLSLLELLNPAHRLWSEGPWNKLVAAHGCYWKKCAFCDTSLDYIKRYDPNSAEVIVDRIEALVAENGVSGFHFVDEALPPALARKISEELLRRKVAIHWWGNIRFDAAFDPDLTALMARAGCIAVTGGLEVAADRLLKAMNKGVTVAQVESVSRGFKRAGVLVHAYLMYGFPSQTEEEIVESLEMVRGLFQKGCLDSAHWHRFSVTAHSPVGLAPGPYGVELIPPETQKPFAKNDLEFVPELPYERYSEGLRRAVYNYMHGVGFELGARDWFTEMGSSDPYGRAAGRSSRGSQRGKRQRAASRSRPKRGSSKTRSASRR